MTAVVAAASGKPAGAYECLELLNDFALRDGHYIRRVQEDVRHRPGVLERRITIDVKVPAVRAELVGTDTSSETPPFVFVLRSPPKGSLWSVREIQVNKGHDYEVLGHEAHLE